MEPSGPQGRGRGWGQNHGNGLGVGTQPVMRNKTSQAHRETHLAQILPRNFPQCSFVQCQTQLLPFSDP